MSVKALLDHEQRRLLLAACLMVAAVSAVTASFNYVVNPMLDDFDAGDSANSLLRQLPSVAALLVVFLSGVLGDRWGARHVLRGGAVAFTTGSVVVLLAPVFEVAALGLVLQAVATSAVLVVGLSVLTARIPDPRARASAFSLFAVVDPLIYLIYPLLVGALVDSYSWRWVAALWAVGGVVMLAAAWRLLPADRGERTAGEWVTPALAGVVLAGGVQAISFASTSGVTSTATLLRAGIAGIALAALVVAMRRLAEPTLSLAALRRGGMVVLLLIVFLLPFANLWYYVTMGLQYIWGLSVLHTALALTPAQVAGLGGALLTRRLLQTRGLAQTGVLLLAGFGLAMLLMLVIAVDSPVWVPVVVMCVYAVFAVGAGVPITTAVMNSAPPGEEGSASAFRSAASRVGNALGVVLTTVLLTGVVTWALTRDLGAEGLATPQSEQIAAGVRDGVAANTLAAQYAVPLAQVEQITTAQQAALVQGLHAVAVLGAVVAFAAAALFPWALRRSARPVAPSA